MLDIPLERLWTLPTLTQNRSSRNGSGLRLEVTQTNEGETHPRIFVLDQQSEGDAFYPSHRRGCFLFGATLVNVLNALTEYPS